jgi:hypothetical protein
MKIELKHVHEYKIFGSITLCNAWILVIDGVPTAIDCDLNFIEYLYNKLN